MSRLLLQICTPAAVVLAGLAMATPASAADVEFASYTAASSGTFKVTTTATPTKPGVVTLSESGMVDFSFLTTNLTPAIKDAVANLVFTATGTSGNYSQDHGYGFQDTLTGSFDFTSTKIIKIGSTVYQAGDTLLKVDFTKATFGVALGTPTGFFSDSSVNGTVTYTSQFLTFPGLVSTDFSLGLTGATPAVGNSATHLPGLTGTLNGGFSADPGPISTAVVPEPTTWAMMLVGFGAIGMGIRANSRRNPRMA